MIDSIEIFNLQFTAEKISKFKNDIASDFDYLPTFRLAETLFYLKELKQLVEGSNQVVAFIQSNDLKNLQTSR
jgi:hypothetical protein